MKKITAMKKIVFSILLLLAFTFRSNAQKAEEISLQYGRVSIPAIAMTTGAVFGIVFTGGAASLDKICTSGAITAEYFHFFNKHLTVGGAVTVEDVILHWKKKTGEKDENGKSIYVPSTTTNDVFMCVLPEFKYRWLAKEHFGMYSKVGFGAMFVLTNDSGSSSESSNDPSSNVSIAFQANPIGIEAGNQRVRGFVELGYGVQGMLMGGVRVTL